MKFEHLALNVKDPLNLVKWYCENLGFSVVKGMDAPPFAHFIVDSSKHILLEIFYLDDKEVIDFSGVDPASVHLGFSVEDIEEEYKKLISAGAMAVSEITLTNSGDKIVMLRDPWGTPVQLLKRKGAMIK